MRENQYVPIVLVFYMGPCTKKEREYHPALSVFYSLPPLAK